MNIDFPKPSELREMSEDYWKALHSEQDNREREESKEHLEEFATIFKKVASEGGSELQILNEDGADNEYFISHLISLGYIITDSSKLSKKISWPK
jgi:hypothetical protein